MGQQGIAGLTQRRVLPRVLPGIILPDGSMAALSGLDSSTVARLRGQDWADASAYAPAAVDEPAAQPVEQFRDESYDASVPKFDGCGDDAPVLEVMLPDSAGHDAAVSG